MTPTPWHSRWVQTGPIGRRWIKTHYLEAGDGEPLVLLHGAGPGAAAEYAWYDTIPALAAHYRVLAPDWLGFGRSDKPTTLNYTSETQVEHVVRFIDTLCLEKVRLVGNSMGAYLAVRYALDYPENVLQVFGIGSNTIAKAMGLAEAGTPARAAMLAYDGTEEKLRDFLNGILLHPPSDNLVRSRNVMANQPGAAEARASYSSYARALRNDQNLQQRFSLSERLPRTTIPIRMVWGAQDAFAPVEFVDELRKLLPNIRIDVLPSAGHQCQNDDPEGVHRRLLDFFGNVPASVQQS